MQHYGNQPLPLSSNRYVVNGSYDKPGNHPLLAAKIESTLRLVESQRWRRRSGYDPARNGFKPSNAFEIVGRDGDIVSVPSISNIQSRGGPGQPPIEIKKQYVRKSW